MTNQTSAFVFPGQGSQAIGMGQSLYDNSIAAKAVFEAVDDALGEKLSTLMFSGESDELTLTQNAQPALMAVSVAAVRAFEETTGKPLSEFARFVAGHSLGEYSALVASGVLDVETAAKLLRTRGNAMQAAVPVGEGAMAAVLGPSVDEVAALGEKAASQTGGVCSVANDNADGQVVLSGSVAAVDAAIELASEAGAKRCVKLPVSAPFHCSLMQPAADAMAKALDGADMNNPSIPVYANVRAKAVNEPSEMRDLLVEQVTGRVRWRETILDMANVGVETIVEMGSGKVLSGLNRRIDKSLTSVSISDKESLDAFVASL